MNIKRVYEKPGREDYGCNHRMSPGKFKLPECNEDYDLALPFIPNIK